MFAADPNTSVEWRGAVDVTGHERGLGLFSDCVIPHSTDAALQRQTTRQNTSGHSLWTLGSMAEKKESALGGFTRISSSHLLFNTIKAEIWRQKKKRRDYQLFNLAFKPWTMSAVGISNLQLKMSISAGIGEVNNKVISQALRISVSGCKGSIQEGSSWLIMIESHGRLQKLRVWISNHRTDCFPSCARGTWQKISD